MSEKGFDLVPLYTNPSLNIQVAELLNSEWPRNMTARLHSLKSSESLPCSLVLLSTSDSAVIGHSKISQVIGKPNDVIIESVVIRKDLRGNGYGRILMECTEKHSKKLGYTSAHLSTHDKCKFYERLGYVYSNPVNPVRASSKFIMNSKFAQMESESLNISQKKSHQDMTNINICRSEPTSVTPSFSPHLFLPPPPPLPPVTPPYPPARISTESNQMMTGTRWMCKAFSL